DDPVAEVDDLGVVGGHDHGGAAVGGVAEEGDGAVAGLPGELGGGFVDQEDGGLDGQGAGQGDPLALAARQLVGALVGAVGEGAGARPARGGGGGGTGGAAGDAERQLDVLPGGEQRQQAVALEHEGDPVAAQGLTAGGAEAGQVLAVEADDPGVGRLQPGQQQQGGRLARPGRPDQPDHLAALDLERHPVDHVAAPAPRHQPVGDQAGHGPSSSPWSPPLVGLSTTRSPSTSTATRAPGGSTSRAWAGRCRDPVGPTTAYSAPPRPSALTRPSRMVTVRSMAAATSASWVTTTTVVPRSWRASLSSSTTRRTLARSSWLVGSSASSRGGLLARATATARRCCSPPDRARIGLSRRGPRSTAPRSTPPPRPRPPPARP